MARSKDDGGIEESCLEPVGAFLDQTMPVVELLFAGLNIYRSLTAETFKAKIVRSLPEAAYVAKTALAGAILQTAHLTLRHYSEHLIPAEPPVNIPNLDRARLFACGRKVLGLPTGLIIYAGRNYWAHLDERTQLEEPSATIIRQLGINRLQEFGVVGVDPGLDPAAEHWSHLSNILHILEWRSIYDYRRDIRICASI